MLMVHLLIAIPLPAGQGALYVVSYFDVDVLICHVDTSTINTAEITFASLLKPLPGDLTGFGLFRTVILFSISTCQFTTYMDDEGSREAV